MLLFYVDQIILQLYQVFLLLILLTILLLLLVYLIDNHVLFMDQNFYVIHLLTDLKKNNLLIYSQIVLLVVINDYKKYLIQNWSIYEIVLHF